MSSEDQLSAAAQHRWRVLVYPLMKAYKSNTSQSKGVRRKVFKAGYKKMNATCWGPRAPVAADDITATEIDTEIDEESA